MTTYRQAIFMVLDLLKMISDDSFYNEEHIMFLLSKYRGLLLKQQYKDIKKDIPESNFQTLCLDLIEVPAIAGEECEGGSYLRTAQKIPNLMTIASPRVYTSDYYQGDITYVSRERMKYVGYNRWLPNIIYASIGPDNYMYLKSFNPQYLYLEGENKLKITGIFEDADKANELDCNKDTDTCDPMDSVFPLEEALIPQVIALVVKDLTAAKYQPEDNINNASDDLSNLIQFAKKNMKSALQKQIEGDEQE